MRIIVEVPDPGMPLPPESVSSASDSEEPFEPRPDEAKFLRTGAISDVEAYLKRKLGLAGTAASAPDASPSALASPPASEDDAPSVQPKTDRTEGNMRKKDPVPLTLGTGART